MIYRCLPARGVMMQKSCDLGDAVTRSRDEISRVRLVTSKFVARSIISVFAKRTLDSLHGVRIFFTFEFSVRSRVDLGRTLQQSLERVAHSRSRVCLI